jgi:hypothetical protein
VSFFWCPTLDAGFASLDLGRSLPELLGTELLRCCTILLITYRPDSSFNAPLKFLASGVPYASSIGPFMKFSS